MDKSEFMKLLEMFPVVRSRSFCLAEAGSSSGNSFQPEIKTREIQNDGNTGTEANFWEKLKIEAEKKVGSDKAEQFVKAFKHAHEKLVYEDLSLETAQNFLKSHGK